MYASSVCTQPTEEIRRMASPRAPLHPPWHANIGHVLHSTHQYAPKAQYAYAHGFQDTRVWCYTSPFCWTVSGLCCISTELTPTTPPKYARKYPKRTPKYTQFNPPRSDNMLNTRVPVFQYPRFSFLFFFHTCTHMSNSPALHTCLSSEASHAILIANLLEHRSVPKTHPFSCTHTRAVVGARRRSHPRARTMSAYN